MDAKKSATNKRKSREDNIEVTVGIVESDMKKDAVDFQKADTDSAKNCDMDDKKYTKTCEKCDHKVEANKMYKSLQKISQHKDHCISSIKCSKCNKRFQGQDHLKFHVCE